MKSESVMSIESLRNYHFQGPEQ